MTYYIVPYSVISIASELSDEERDKFRIELYQGNKVVAIKQITSQFSHTKENHGSSIEVTHCCRYVPVNET